MLEDEVPSILIVELMGEISQLFACLFLGLYSERGYVELVIVKVEVKHRNDDCFQIVLEVLQLLELLIDFRHLLQQ